MKNAVILVFITMSCVRNATRIYLPLVISSESIGTFRKRTLMNSSQEHQALTGPKTRLAPRIRTRYDAMGEAELDLEDVGNEFEFALDD